MPTPRGGTPPHAPPKARRARPRGATPRLPRRRTPLRARHRPAPPRCARQTSAYSNAPDRMRRFPSPPPFRSVPPPQDALRPPFASAAFSRRACSAARAFAPMRRGLASGRSPSRPRKSHVFSERKSPSAGPPFAARCRASSATASTSDSSNDTSVPSHGARSLTDTSSDPPRTATVAGGTAILPRTAFGMDGVPPPSALFHAIRRTWSA